MDHALVQFRQAAARENRGRRDVRRRYSATLRRQAVEYCLTRRQHGERLRDVAVALGCGALESPSLDAGVAASAAVSARRRGRAGDADSSAGVTGDRHGRDGAAGGRS